VGGCPGGVGVVMYWHHGDAGSHWLEVEGRW
jgi:hypothetical protein